MTPFVLIILALVSFLASGASYFFARIKAFSCALFLFYASNTALAFLLFYGRLTILFYFIITILVAFPVLCLLLFLVDKYLALFCTDTSFVLVIVWLLMPALFIANVIRYIIVTIYA